MCNVTLGQLSSCRMWVRNVIDHQGIEFIYNLYAPTVLKIETLRLEKRLDDELYYLRDAPQQYSAFPQDMEMEILPEGVPVPVNDIVVPLNPQPWGRNVCCSSSSSSILL